MVSHQIYCVMSRSQCKTFSSLKIPHAPIFLIAMDLIITSRLNRERSASNNAHMRMHLLSIFYQLRAAL